MPEPDPPLKMTPSSWYQLRIPSIVSSTARMNTLDACCGVSLTPMLNQTGLVEGGALVHEDVLQLVAERRALLVVDEVAVAHAPRGDRVGDAIDDLAERLLALVGAERAAEVLLGDDVRGVLGPRDGELDIGLVEGVGPVLEVLDAGVAPFPLDRVVGVRPPAG